MRWQEILLKGETDETRSATANPRAAALLDRMAKADLETPDSSPQKPGMLSAFGLLFADLGDYRLAQQQCLRAFKLGEIQSGGTSDSVLLCMANLARLYILLGDWDRVELIAGDALSTLAPQSPAQKKWDAVFLLLLSTGQLEKGLQKDADTSTRRAIESVENQTSPSALASALLARGRFQRNTGDLARARELLQKAVESAPQTNREDPLAKETFESFDRNWIAGEALQELYEVLIAEDRFVEARRLEPTLEKCFSKRAGIVTPAQARFLMFRSILANRVGEFDEARRCSMDYLRYVDGMLPAALGMVESQRLGWQRTFLNFSIPVAFLSPEELAEYVLRWKGTVLDSMVGDRRGLGLHKTDAALALSAELASSRQRLLQLTIQSGGTSSGSAEIPQLRNRIFHLEMKIAEESRFLSARGQSAATAARLREALALDEAVVEFISYGNISEGPLGEKRLGAVVFTKERDPSWVPLGSAEPIRELATRMQALVSADPPSDSRLEETLSSLHARLWAKVATILPPDTKTVFVSPDDFLHFVPFACLLDADGRFLGESLSVGYVGSARDLLTGSSLPARRELVVFANPVFDSALSNEDAPTLATRTPARREFQSIALPPLPGTRREAEALEKLAQANGWRAVVHSAKAAEERKLAAGNPPAILHLATHGFYLAEDSGKALDPNFRGMGVKPTENPAGLENAPRLDPMLQSGIALNGAARTLRLWTEGRAPDPSNDGVVSAMDVAGLDLKGTWLVTLSACDTGVGVAKSGEGVFGLKRSFMMAGTQNLMITLWPVSDETTPEIMEDFYASALRSMNAPESLAGVQRDWLTRLRREKGTTEAVRNAGPFALVAMSNPRLRTNEILRSDRETQEGKAHEAEQRRRSMPQPRNIDRLEEIFR